MGRTVTKGEIGVPLKTTVSDKNGIVDISGATTNQVDIKKPDGTVATKTATFETDGTDGIAQYITVASDLDQAGTYVWQSNLVVSATSAFRSLQQTFLAEDTLS